MTDRAFYQMVALALFLAASLIVGSAALAPQPQHSTAYLKEDRLQ